MMHSKKKNAPMLRAPMDSKARAVTEIMLTIFRINGLLLEVRRCLGRAPRNRQRPVALSGRRFSGGKAPFGPQIVEAMGITRQGVQKQLNRMLKDNLFEKRPNPRHERSSLYWPTQKGQRIYSEAMHREALWARRLAEDLSGPDLQEALDLLKKFLRLLDIPLPDEGGRR
jgi:DNA-binding MarR family transcriptional regulator